MPRNIFDGGSRRRGGGGTSVTGPDHQSAHRHCRLRTV